MKSQVQELETAIEEGREPICNYCEKPLDIVCQFMPTYVHWIWNPKAKRYTRIENSGDLDKPYHHGCGRGSWILVESGTATLKLGLEY